MKLPNEFLSVPFRGLTATLVIASFATPITQAALQSYRPDADTLHLYTFEEARGMSFAANLGTKGGKALTVRETSRSVQRNVAQLRTDMLGYAGFAGFGDAVRISSLGTPENPSGMEGLGFDYNGDGNYDQGMINHAAADRVVNYKTYFPGSYTLEAMVNLPSITDTDPLSGRTIISFDSSSENHRSIFFRVASGQLQLLNTENTVGITRAIAIPTTGPDAFEPDVWFHVAVAHRSADGGSTQFYWTRVDPSRTQANAIGPRFTGPQTPLNRAGTPTLAFGSDSRQAFTQSLGGLLDNVRISAVARGPRDFIFHLDEIGLSVARDGRDILLGWSPPQNITSPVNIYRHTKPEKNERIHLAAVHAESSSFADHVPSGSSSYWYWVDFINASGILAEYGPFETKPTAVWHP